MIPPHARLNPTQAYLLGLLIHASCKPYLNSGTVIAPRSLPAPSTPFARLCTSGLQDTTSPWARARSGLHAAWVCQIRAVAKPVTNAEHGRVTAGCCRFNKRLFSSKSPCTMYLCWGKLAAEGLCHRFPLCAWHGPPRV